ncbi:AAA family ATPase [Pseudobacillus badius]|uniref:AAA family ATPase n=1 Tax=Bacillus badius TaxID=1455 RepID=UPI003CE86EB5
MNTIVRVKEVEIINLKNVKNGRFLTNTSFEQMKKADIVGFYGQNGSGKTAIVEAFALLETLLFSHEESKLPENSENLLYSGEQMIQLTFHFLVQNEYGEFFVRYYVGLSEGKERLYVVEEELSYRENEKKKRFKNLISKKKNDITIRNKKVTSMNEEERVAVLVANKMAAGNSTSFVFNRELQDEAVVKHFTEEEWSVFGNLMHEFCGDLHVIKNTQYGLLIANIVMPFSIHFENKRGQIPYEMRDMMIMPVPMFETLQQVVSQTNIVLETIIPGLQIKINRISYQKMDDGSEGVRFEFLSKRGDIELPLRSESEGILKIISVLSTLIAVYNNPNACVVIDEMDAGIFEYLLGELLQVLSRNGKGQLFFTSHNLRVLEVLPIHDLWFTTLNESERYIQLKGVKKLSNARDIYLRAVQLGGQQEPLYAETNLFDIKTSFRKAGAYR